MTLKEKLDALSNLGFDFKNDPDIYITIKEGCEVMIRYSIKVSYAKKLFGRLKVKENCIGCQSGFAQFGFTCIYEGEEYEDCSM